MNPISPTNDPQLARPVSAWREWLRMGLPLALLAAIVVALAWHFVQPAPPSHVVMATGSAQGAYFAFGQQYAEYFRVNGVHLEVKETVGSVENYKLLMDPKSGVDVAIVQGGTAPPAAARPHLQTVANIYFEPVWVFYRGDATVTRLLQLAGKKIFVGKEGSGVRPLATLLLSEAGVNDHDAGTTFFPRDEKDTKDPADALAAGDIDAAFYVISPKAAVVTKLLQTPGIRLMSFEQAGAYGRRYSFLSPVTLYQGSIDIHNNLPEQDVHLIASHAALVIRDSTHEAIIQLLVREAQEIHSAGTLVSEAGIFPAADRTELPVNHDAKYFLNNKPGFLHRTFPFWLASLIDRTLILVLPLLVFFLPLIRMLPPLYAWRIRSRIYKWYRQVRRIDERLNERSPRAEIEAGRDELARVEKELLTVRVPLSYMEELYNLRLHVGYVRSRLETWLGGERKDATRTTATVG